MPRKQITLPSSLIQFVQLISSKCQISESSIISFSIKKLVDLYNAYCDNSCEDVFYYKVSEFYNDYFTKALPRGKKSKEVKQ